jgi:hypothetical protein
MAEELASPDQLAAATPASGVGCEAAAMIAGQHERRVPLACRAVVAPPGVHHLPKFSRDFRNAVAKPCVRGAIGPDYRVAPEPNMSACPWWKHKLLESFSNKICSDA